MATVNHPEFQTYLQSISEKYKCWWNFYTLTDAEYFDFGLMVQEVQPKQERKNQQEEEIEPLPVLEGIRNYADKHVLLIGKPGSGKSTALQRLLWEDAEAIIQGEKRIIPVLVELRNWDTSVETLIYKFLRKNKLRIDKDKIEDLLFDGELLLLMDGLNELPSDKARVMVAQFRQNYSETPMIFTTRDLGVGGNLGINKQLEMQPLTEKQMQDFVQKYLPQQGERMLQQLHNRLRELGETPLILKMLCDVFKSSGEIPENRGELFRKFDSEVNRLKENKETVPIPEGLRGWKGELLQYLAFEMMQPENSQVNPTDFRLSISRSQTEAILKIFLKGEVEFPAQKAKDWLDGLLKHCLLESKTSESEQVVIEFHHQLFQEYYAAEYFLLRLLPNLSDEKLKRDYLNLLKWTEPVALMLGLVEDETQALRVVKLALEVDLMLGARLAGEVRKEFQVKTIEIVSGLEVTELIKYELLGISKSEFAAKYLIKALDDKDSNVRYYAISQLKYVIGLDEVISLVIEALEDKESNVRESAISELHNIAKIHNYNNIVDILINILQFNKFQDIRSKAIFILDYYRFMGHIRATDGLIMALQDEDLYVRYCAASRLKHFRPLENIDYSQIDKIIKLYDEQNFDYYIEIEELNKEFDKKSEAAAIYIDYTCRDICYGLNDDYNSVENFLHNTLQDEDQHIRNAAIEELVKIDNSMAVDIFISALQHTDLSIHNKAAIALKNNASSNILSQMWQMLLSDIFNTKDIILKIQNRCNFYNHDIFYSPPIEDNSNSQPSQITYNICAENIGNVAHNVQGNQQVNPPQ